MAANEPVVTKSLDIDRAFKFVFQDPEWVKKIGIGGILSITFIGIFAVIGWVLEIQRDVIREKRESLPDWSRLGDYFFNGLGLVIVNMVWTLPLQLFNCVLFSSFFVSMSTFTQQLENWDGNPPPPEMVLPSWSLSLQPIVYLLSFLSLIILPIASGLLVDTETLRGALNFKRGVKLFLSNWKQFLGVTFLGLVANNAAFLAGFVALCVGIFFALPIGLAISHHLYGQAYRNALAKV